MNVSKALLSEVLGEDINDIVNDKTTPKNIFQYEIKKVMLDGSGVAFREINIYELANKCKEWAVIKQFYNVASLLDYTGYTCIIRQDPMTLLNTELRFRAGTEPEAIFQSCKWILDNKDKQ